MFISQLVNIFNTFDTFAVCPICTVTVGAGLALAEKIGVDMLVVSVWVGGLLASMTMWSINWLETKQKTFKFYRLVMVLLFYVLTFITLHFTDFLWNEGNTLFGIDKIILGTAAGTAVFIGASQFYQYLKQKNNGHAHFPFEKVVIPIISLVILSIIAYFLTK
ncbi:MAG: hypothetical protein Q3996_00030 [Candidatus Saccharibacteria bacterium]|nr:hypothetical protein [Candidatus Saccharibacteria bacterium]